MGFKSATIVALISMVESLLSHSDDTAILAIVDASGTLKGQLAMEQCEPNLSAISVKLAKDAAKTNQQQFGRAAKYIGFALPIRGSSSGLKGSICIHGIQSKRESSRLKHELLEILESISRSTVYEGEIFFAEAV